MDWEKLDWEALAQLRTDFLNGTAGQGDYWKNESTIASYDATFAQRIGWKWDYVLAELKRRGWTPPRGEVLDWGCGSGIAGRAFLDHFGTNDVTVLRLSDRSSMAVSFAARRAQEKYPRLTVNPGLAESPAVLLVSHVLTELTPDQIQSLADFASTAQCVIWVEPGTYEASLTLISIRERLRGRMQVIAPCTHQEQCGILAPKNERHWCHHFAAPPPAIFTDGDWARFAAMIGVDLRDLPLSFLVLDSRPAPTLPPGATRVLGHPRVYKAHALLLSCDATGVTERRLTKRTQSEAFKQARKGDLEPLQMMQCEVEEITAIEPLGDGKQPD